MREYDAYKIKILAPAWLELEEIADYHLKMASPASADKITNNILNSLERLKEQPLSGAPIFDDELRALGYRVVISGKYVIIYQLIGDTVFIYHIVHGSRDYPQLFK